LILEFLFQVSHFEKADVGSLDKFHEEIDIAIHSSTTTRDRAEDFHTLDGTAGTRRSDNSAHLIETWRDGRLHIPLF